MTNGDDSKPRVEPLFSFGTRELADTERATSRRTGRRSSGRRDLASLGPGERGYGFDPYNNSGRRDPSRRS
jgi:hypothetical protein